MCCMYHVAGSCKFGSSCPKQRSHAPPLGAERGRFLAWIAMCRRLMKKRNASEELQPYTVPLTALDRLFPLNTRSPHQRPCPIPTLAPIPIPEPVSILPCAIPTQPIISEIHTRPALAGKSPVLPNHLQLILLTPKGGRPTYPGCPLTGTKVLHPPILLTPKGGRPPTSTLLTPKRERCQPNPSG